MRALVMALALLLSSTADAATVWHVQRDASRLGFVGTQQGGEFEGRFEAFTAAIRFSPDDLANSRFHVTIDVTSVTTGSSQRDQQLGKAAWFDFDAHPKAVYDAESFRAVGDGRFEADGNLTIRGNTHKVTLPFAWARQGDTAGLRGEVTINRTDYGIGQGQWAAGDTVGREVRVVVDLMLESS